MTKHTQQQNVDAVATPRFFEIHTAESLEDMTSPQLIHKNDEASLEEMMAKMPESFHNFFEIQAA